MGTDLKKLMAWWLMKELSILQNSLYKHQTISHSKHYIYSQDLAHSTSIYLHLMVNCLLRCVCEIDGNFCISMEY